MAANRYTWNPPEDGREALEHLLAQPPVLWHALDQLVTLATERMSADPTAQELAAYAAGRLPQDRVEWIREYVTLHPEALSAVGGPPLLGPVEASGSLSVEKLAVWWALKRELRTADLVADPEPLVLRARGAMRTWKGQAILGPDEPSPSRVREFVEAVYSLITELNAAAGVPSRVAADLGAVVLQSCFPVLALYRASLVDLAAHYLVWQWRGVGGSFGIKLPGPERIAALGRLASRLENHELQSLPRFQAAVFEVLRNEDAQRSGKDTLAELASKLDLTADQIGQMLKVSGETIADWIRSGAPIPQAKLAMLSVVRDSLDRLTTMFLVERLPQAIRREARLFEGDTALDWILQGRIREVADRYDLLLRYQS